MQVLERGQERFNIYCTPCHSRVGNGDGMIVAARLQAGRQFPRRQAAGRAAEPLLLCHDQRLRRHAGLLGAAAAGRSLGGRGLYSRPAVEPEREGERCACRHADSEPFATSRSSRGCRPATPVPGASRARPSMRCRRRASLPERRPRTRHAVQLNQPPVKPQSVKSSKGADGRRRCSEAAGFTLGRSWNEKGLQEERIEDRGRDAWIIDITRKRCLPTSAHRPMSQPGGARRWWLAPSSRVIAVILAIPERGRLEPLPALLAGGAHDDASASLSAGRRC